MDGSDFGSLAGRPTVGNSDLLDPRYKRPKNLSFSGIGTVMVPIPILERVVRRARPFSAADDQVLLTKSAAIFGSLQGSQLSLYLNRREF